MHQKLPEEKASHISRIWVKLLTATRKRKIQKMSPKNRLMEALRVIFSSPGKY